MTTGMATGDNGNGTMIGSLTTLTGEDSKTLFSDLAGVTAAVAHTLSDALADDLAGGLALAAKSCSRPPPPYGSGLPVKGADLPLDLPSV